MPLSGPEWVSKFPTTNSLYDLAEPFRARATRFIAALRAAHATVTIADTLRPPERAYLMHFSFLVAREGLDPLAVEAMAGVDIQWAHPDAVASKAAAEQMVHGYGVVFKPALRSRHTEGRALDMNIEWQNDLVIARADGSMVTISSTPRTGAKNAELHQAGASYGVIKLLTDAPHWSEDGH
jgi:hypothetical protein